MPRYMIENIVSGYVFGAYEAIDAVDALDVLARATRAIAITLTPATMTIPRAAI
jgi:hypothetical protein